MPRARIDHVPALDGLRGLAVLGVLLFHAGAPLRGGYLGVDLFFVLSGYLITAILLAEHASSGRIDLWAFWVRRARRLFPALLSLMPAIAAYAAWFAQSDELPGLRGDALATLAYFANWRAVFARKSYWELFTAPSPLEHTWSLAIEEQFYLVWPLLVVLVLVVLKRSRRTLLVITGALLVASALAMLWLFDPEDSSRVYFGTDTRAAAILAGAALALALPATPTLSARALRRLDGLGVVAALGLAAAWLGLDGQAPLLYRGGFWLTELGTLILIACGVTTTRGSTTARGVTTARGSTTGRGAAPAPSVVARVLALRPLTFLGTISYGLYLWHWPVNCVLTAERLHVGALGLGASRFALAFLIATLSYRLYEHPIRTRGLFFGRPLLVVPASVAACVLLVLRSTDARPLPALLPANGASRLSPSPTSQASRPRFPGPFDVDAHTLPPPAALPPGTLRVLTLGDSVAIKLGIAMRQRQQGTHVFVAERGVGDCSILSGVETLAFGHKLDHGGNGCATRWDADVRETLPDLTLIVLGGGFFSRVQQHGAWQAPCQHGWRDLYQPRLESLLDTLRPHAGRVVLALVPYPVGRWRWRGLPARVDCFNAVLRDIAKAHGLATADLKTHVCPAPECLLTSDDAPIRPDGLHFDGVGARETAEWTLGELARLGAALPQR